jgi:hypothetical protein
MKIFLSWSGKRSQEIASIFFEHLPDIIQEVNPFFSTESIRIGTRWMISLSQELSDTKFGIVFIDQTNQQAPWICFEAGAIAKVVSESRVVPILFGMKKSQVHPPLSQFQMMEYGKESVLDLLIEINKNCVAPLTPSKLAASFERVWGEIETKISGIVDKYPFEEQEIIESKDNTDTSDMLVMLRDISRRLAIFEEKPPRPPVSGNIRSIVTPSTNEIYTKISISLRPKRGQIAKRKIDELVNLLNNNGYKFDDGITNHKGSISFDLIGVRGNANEDGNIIHNIIFLVFGSEVEISTGITEVSPLFT